MQISKRQLKDISFYQGIFVITIFVTIESLIMAINAPLTNSHNDLMKNKESLALSKNPNSFTKLPKGK